jgi:hypothetical protein
MNNNKQQTAVEWFSVRRDVLEIEVRLGKLSPIEYAEELTKAEQKAKEMEKEETTKFTIGYFNWLHNNGYKYNPKVKMYWKMMINETLFFTIEELMIEFNKIQGGEQ